MLGWQNTTGKRMAMALLVCLTTLWSWSAHAYRKFASQERQHQQVSQQLAQLKQTYAVRERGVQKAARQLEKLQRQARQGGLLRLPARLRLSNARAKAQRLSARLAKLNRRIKRLNQRKQTLRRQLRKLYRKRYNEIRKALGKRLSRSRRKQLQQEAVILARRYQGLHPKAQRSARPSNLPRLRIKINPLDGPIELRQKADRIKDAEDNVSRILRKLKRKLKRIQKKAKRQRSEDRLEKWVDTGDTGDSLFQERSRNPRVVTGKSTSDRIRSKNARAFRLPSLSGQSTQCETKSNSGNQGTAAPPPTSPSAPSAGSNSKGAGNSADPGSRTDQGGTGGFQNNDSAAPRGTTHLQPQVGPNTTLQPGMGQRGQMPSQGYTLNPKGTVKQQLKALKRYQAHLKRYRAQLRRHHKVIQQHAKRLRRRRR